MKINLAMLAGLSAANFAHPSDQAALARLAASPCIDELVGKLVDLQKREIERGLIASSINATPAITPRLHGIYRDVARALGFEEPYPPLYIEHSPVINACTTGADQPYVCATSTAVDTLSEDELRFVLGHELGHVLAGHVRYSTLTHLLVQIGRSAGFATGHAGQSAVDLTAIPLLMSWSRRAEYTADRGGLLACQDTDAAFRALMKMGGYPAQFERCIDASVFLEQLEAFGHDTVPRLIDPLFSLGKQSQVMPPRIVERAAELKRWIDDGSYNELLTADEPTRRAMRPSAETDPQYADLIDTATRVLQQWSAAEFRIPTPEAARLVRQMLTAKAPMHDTPLERLLRVEIVARADDAGTLAYHLSLQLARGGQPVRIQIDLPYASERHHAPTCIRRELDQSNDGSATCILHSARRAFATLRRPRSREKSLRT
jgi:Zn-dependent protease with chaperone function